MEATSQVWANNCIFAHSNPKSQYGENLFLHTGGPSQSELTNAGAAWWSEVTKKGIHNQTTAIMDVASLSAGDFTQVQYEDKVVVSMLLNCDLEIMILL